jgi:hypothetical protein
VTLTETAMIRAISPTVHSPVTRELTAINKKNATISTALTTISLFPNFSPL